MRDLIHGVAYLATAARGAHAVAGRRDQGVHRVGAHDRGHRPRAAGDAGQRHGRPGAAARARLRHRRLDRDRRQDHRPHPRGPLARHHAGRPRTATSSSCPTAWSRAPCSPTSAGPTAAHRQWVFIRVHFRHPPAQVRELVVGRDPRRCPACAAIPRPTACSGSSRTTRSPTPCRYWIDDFHLDDRSDSEVRSIIWYALHRAGMEIPFPSLNVNMTEMNEDRVARKLDEDYARRVDALSRVDVFRALDAEKIDRLARRLRMAIFGPGEVILRQGDPGDSLYVVRSGRVAVELATRGGGRREIAMLSAGQFFGEMSLMTGESRDADRGREDRRRLLHRREGSVPADPGRKARAGRHHQRDPDPPAGHARRHELHAGGPRPPRRCRRISCARRSPPSSGSKAGP